MSDKTPRERRKEKNRQAILDTATTLILSNGLENISLREIAKQADYSPAGLYKYFDSKAAIIKGVFERENQKLFATLQSVRNDHAPKDYLVLLSLRYVAFALENKVFPVLLNALSGERRSKEEAVPSSSPYALFLNAVQAWVTSDSIQLADDYGAEEITYALWAFIHGMASLQANQLKKFDGNFRQIDEESIERFLKSFY